jgi:transposase-like protein
MNRIWTQNRIEASRRTLNTGKTVKETAKFMGCTEQALRNALQRNPAAPQHPATVPSPPPAAPAAPPEDPTIDDAIEETRAQRAARVAAKQLKAAVDRIETLSATVSRLSAPSQPPAFSIVKHLGSDKRKAWGLSVLSDIHAGAHVVPSASVCFNRYDPEICRYRLDRYFESIPWLINDEHSFDVHGHCLAALGDLIDGHLHDDQTETSEAPLVTVDWLEPFLWGRLESLATELGPYRELRILWVPGNHGRDTLKPRAATYCQHSHEWAMGQRLARHFATHATIRVHAPTARDVYTTIWGRDLHGTHGDTVSYQGGVGGITIPLRKAYAMWQMLHPSSLHLTGHFHTMLDLGDGLANGSGIGYNDFARKCNARPEPAQQIFCLLDEKRGKTKVSPIWMQDLDAEEKLAMAEAQRAWEAQALRV